MKILSSLLLLILAACGPANSPASSARALTIAHPPTFFSVEPDARECIAPVCGGVILRALNEDSTLCADGVSRPACYVAEVLIGGMVDTRFNSNVIFEGNIVAHDFPGFGNLGAVEVTNVFEGENDTAPSPAAGSLFYSVRPDLRACVSPICGGNFVAALNLDHTTCVDGTTRSECYAAETDATVPDGALVQATLQGKSFGSFGVLGELTVANVFVPVDLTPIAIEHR
jgi:hypothetical protein